MMKQFFEEKVTRRLVALYGGKRNTRITKQNSVKVPAFESFLRGEPGVSIRKESDHKSNEPPHKDQSAEQSAQAQMSLTFYAIAEIYPEEPETAPLQINTVQPEPPSHTPESPAAGDPDVANTMKLPDSPENATSAGCCEQPDDKPPYVDWVFRGEDESDYTSGAAKMVVASDGFKECAAILLTMELSARIQLAVNGQRDLQRTEFLIQQDREMFEVEEQRIYSRLIGARQDLEILSRREDHAEPQVAASVQDYRMLVSDLKSEHIRVKEELGSLEDVIQRAYAKQRIIQAEANVILDDVLVNCNLLESHERQTEVDPELPPLQISTRQRDRSIPSRFPRFPSPQSLYQGDREPCFGLGSGMNSQEDESPQARARRALIQNRIELVKAEEEFDRYQDYHGTDPNARQRAAVAGLEIESRTDLDLFNLKRGQELTRRLIEAEDAVRTAHLEARMAGLNDDQASNSGKQMETDDESLEVELRASTDMPSVERWLEDLEPDATSDIPPDNEADDWNFEVDDQVWESVSTMAQGSERERIDRWRAIAQDGV